MQYRGRYQLRLEEARGLLRESAGQRQNGGGGQGAGAELDALGADGGRSAGPRALAAVATAKKYLGTPYRWGGSTPQTGFDCSGLVQWAYAKAGIRIPRTSEQQILAANGRPVDRRHLIPGDLVFFRDSSGDVHHVGISLGGDKFINAPHTGDVVKIASLKEPYYAQQFTGGRRFDLGAARGARCCRRYAPRGRSGGGRGRRGGACPRCGRGPATWHAALRSGEGPGAAQGQLRYALVLFLVVARIVGPRVADAGVALRLGAARAGGARLGGRASLLGRGLVAGGPHPREGGVHLLLGARDCGTRGAIRVRVARSGGARGAAVRAGCGSERLDQPRICPPVGWAQVERGKLAGGTLVSAGNRLGGRRLTGQRLRAEERLLPDLVVC